MPPTQEEVTLESQSGGATRAIAGEVVRRSNAVRGMMVAAYCLGGVLLMAPCILIPGPHMVLALGVPVVAVILAMRVWKRRELYFDIEGPCPACNAPIKLNGGLLSDRAWQVCPECSASLTVRPKDAPAADAVANPVATDEAPAEPSARP